MMETLMAAPVASAIFIITILTSLMAFSNEDLLAKLILHPYTVYRKKNIYTVFTSGLIHNDWMHLIFNMFSYFFFAFNLERLIGHWQFGFLYIVSLALSDLPTIFKHKDDYGYRSLGASGAVSAVIFGSILYNPWATLMILPLPIPIWYFAFGVLYLVYCHYAAKYARDNVNHDAHLFGAICGLGLTIILHPSILPAFFQQISEGAKYHLHF
ncbi:Rhomboid family protein [Mucilaginibacter mallensis]|uniref:Rhomboid family protein n=1 Tax=Mucilaginibacter mallensis TaxID=652787 RepID=A0A1H1MSI1_MUCMA|nr:rhomboid family intramembrane serine protease [Mucilaginibacter mallensis]SDR89873.1 Rhomboid family protein [Mucilaginibacter mallensis]